MQLQDFYDYKNQLMEDLLTHREIVRLIDENVDIDDAASLAYNVVWPCEYIPDTAQEGKTYICFDVDVFEVEDSKNFGKTFLQPTIFIWVFTHRSKIRLPEGGLRTDKLISEICKVINGSMKYGMGELNLYAVKRFAPMTDYNGKVMAFHTKEFNRQYDPRKYIPANRKGY